MFNKKENDKKVEPQEKPDSASSAEVNYSDLMAAAGEGMGFLTAGDLSIPFLSIIQKMSPQVDRKHAKYLPDAVPGMVINSVTGELYDVECPTGSPATELLVIPCGYQKRWIEWTPRKSGGGLVKVHLTDEVLAECQKNDKNKDVLPNGNEIVESAIHSVIVISEGKKPYPAIMSLSSTQLKKSRKWNTIMSNISLVDPKTKREFTPPSFAFSYRLTTVVEEFAQGSASGWRIEPHGPVKDMELFKKSSTLAIQVKTEPLALGGGEENLQSTLQESNAPY